MRLTLLICAFLLLPQGFAEAQIQETLTVQSRSGQFAVQTTRGSRSTQPLPAQMRARAGEGWFFLLRPQSPFQHSGGTARRLTLDPSLTVVFCENIKQALLRELGMPDQWQQKIQVRLDSSLKEEDIALTAAPHPSGWMYLLQLPGDIDEVVLVRTLVTVLVFEIVHRNTGGELVDLPRWLVDGMIEHLQATGFAALTPQKHVNRVLQPNSIAEVHARVQRRPPLTFEELSWPETLPSERGDGFADSAHLFVRQLLRLPQGRAAFRRFIEGLHAYRNWQFAFLKAYEPHFKSLRDVEKWWALYTVTLTGRSPSKFWSLEKSLDKLDTTLTVPVQVHVAANRLPQRSTMSFQEVIEQWDPARQRMALQKAIAELRVLRLRVPVEVLGLVDDYRVVLENYYHSRDQTGGYSPRRGAQPVNLNLARQSALRQLDQLDHRRLGLDQSLAMSGGEEAAGRP